MNRETYISERIEEEVMNHLERNAMPVMFRGEYDWVNAYVRLREHPPVEVMFGTYYTLDGRVIRHEAQPGKSDDIVLEEGEVLEREVFLPSAQFSPGAPGADVLYLNFSTE